MDIDKLMGDTIVLGGVYVYYEAQYEKLETILKKKN